jgi:hypothetical protein
MNRNERLTRELLLFGALPIWVGAGLVDWWCHRRTRIEETAGLPESLSHVAMVAEAGVPASLALFLEVDPPLLALTYAATALHTATAYWDLAYAARRREVPPTEQHAHAFLEVLPIAVAAFLTVLHPRAASALVRGDLRRWRLRARHHPLHPRIRLGLLGAIAALQGFPHTEEVLRCARAARRRARSRLAGQHGISAERGASISSGSGDGPADRGPG